MKILGIHDGHNATACLLVDGEIKYCLQEERLRNEKNYWGFPSESINTILYHENLKPSDIDHIAMAGKHTPKPANVIGSYKKRTSRMKALALDLSLKTPLYPLYRYQRRIDRSNCLQNAGLPIDRITYVEHHLCHAAAAYYGSPWKDERVLTLTNDGSGDGLCSTIYIGENGKLTKVTETPKGHSIGNIYAVVTFMLGLVPWEHEWKIMGLAPYAPEKGLNISYDVFRRYIKLSDSGLTFERTIHEPTYSIYPRLRRDLELHRFDWICAGVQKATEDLLSQWIKNAIAYTGIRKVALSGGVFMNVKANKKIMELPEIDDLFVVPSCGDESNAIGAAYWQHAEHCKEQGKPIYAKPLQALYLGPPLTSEEAENTLKKNTTGKFTYYYIDDIEKEIARLLAEGKIVARCKGRMEFGARALGNRSILADPSNYECVRTINMMVKKRDFWMPFAPVILKEREQEYIVNSKNIASPYMILSFDTTKLRHQFYAAVHQADLTGRPQILEKSWNPEYYRILKEFERRTGRGVLLNTSFNLHGYPIVYGPREALWVFQNSGLEYLAVGNYLVTK